MTVNFRHYSVFISVLFAGFLLFLLPGCSAGDFAEHADDEIAYAVEIAEAETGDFVFRFQESGEIVPGRQAYLVPKAAGEVTSINARSGETVRKGEVILSVENTYQSIQLQQAKAGREAMKNELDKLEKLVESGAIPEAELRKLKVEFEQLELTLELAQYGYETTYLKAPFDGVISELMIDEGQLIGHEPIGRLVSTSIVRVRLTVTEDYIGNFYRGMLVEVEVPSAGVQRHGEVISIGKASVPETRSYLVEIELNNPAEKLLPGMFATVNVSTEKRESVMLPGSALFEEGGKSYIFVPDNNDTSNGRQTARIKEVTTGYRKDGMTEITSGINEGDYYILRPPPGFKDGSSFTVSGGAGS